MTPQFQVVAFDCDGVLFDTVAANTAYYNSILAAMGRPEMTPSQFAYAHMHTAEAALANLFPDTEDYDQAQAHRRRMGYASFIPLMRMEPHLTELLRRLRPVCRTALVTNRADTMPAVLAAFDLESAFDLVVTALDVAHPKPHPEPLLRVLSHFHLPSESVLYVGDSRVDEVAAEAAGVPLAAFDNPALASARYHIQSLRDLTPIIFN